MSEDREIEVVDVDPSIGDDGAILIATTPEKGRIGLSMTRATFEILFERMRIALDRADGIAEDSA